MVGGHETILVVEDDKLVRDYVLTQLHSLGYVTLDAANAALKGDPPEHLQKAVAHAVERMARALRRRPPPAE